MRFLVNQSNLNEEQARELLYQNQHKIAIDIETVSIEIPLPLGIGIAVSEDIAFYFFNVRDEMLYPLFEETPIIITHNGKFDLPLLRGLGYTVSGFEDTKMIAYAGGILDNSLQDLSESILHRPCPSVTDQWRKPKQGNIAISHVEMGQICMTHAINTYLLEKKLPKTKLYHDIDKPYVELLMEMEQWGVLIDQFRLTCVEQQAMDKALPMEAKLKEELHVDNLASNPQVAQALRDLGIIGTRKTGSDKMSVSNDSLKPLDLDITNRLLEWRSIMKTLTTYVPAFRGNINSKGEKQGLLDANGRLHTQFGYTRTGRNSSRKPNLQNITRDSKFAYADEEEEEEE